MTTKEKIILLIEDNPDDIKLTKRALEKSMISSEVIVAHDGVEALDYLCARGNFAGRDTSVMPKVILLDLNMPRMNGFEFLRRLRKDQRTKFLPVIVLTTSNEERDKMESYRLCANSYVRKPVDFHHFMEAVKEIVLYWLVLNEGPPLERAVCP